MPNPAFGVIFADAHLHEVRPQRIVQDINFRLGHSWTASRLSLRQSPTELLFGSIAARTHAAPPPFAATCSIKKKQRAFACLAHLHLCQFIFTQHLGHRIGDGKQQVLRLHEMPFELPEQFWLRAGSLRDLTEACILLEDRIQRRQFFYGRRT